MGQSKRSKSAKDSGATTVLASNSCCVLCRVEGDERHLPTTVLAMKQSVDRHHLADFLNAMDQVVDGESVAIVLDFEGCARVNSLVVGHLVTGILRARKGGKDVSVRVSPEVGRLFHNAHLDHLFPFQVIEAPKAPVTPAGTEAAG
ncbi:MAG: STAS domain-containing protein [Planctomycetes bacterium]|nr:STAS domain-containing protein [Planctomycetota bacterium]